MPRRATWICLASLVFVAACTPAWKNRPTPFATPRDAFYPSLKVIAVTPIVLPRDVDDPETVRVKFHRLIEERLPARELTRVLSQQNGLGALADNQFQGKPGDHLPVAQVGTHLDPGRCLLFRGQSCQ